MRFPILLKLGVLFTAVLVAAMISVLWNTNNIFYNDKEAFVIELSSKLSNGVSQVLLERTGNEKSKLAIFASNFESLTTQQKADRNIGQVLFSQYSSYYAISALNKKTGKVRWSLRNPTSKASSWKSKDLQALFGQLDLSKFEGSRLKFSMLPGPDSTDVVALGISVKLQELKKTDDYVIVGFMTKGVFSSVVAPYKASLNTAFVVDTNGSVYAHSVNDVVGKKLLEHQIVSEVVKTQRKSGASDDYKDLKKQEIAGSFEQVESSNLYAIITTPKKEAFKAANELFKSLIVIGFGVILVALVLSFFFAKLITSPLNSLRRIAAEIGSGNFDVPVKVKSKDEVGELANSIGQMAQSLIERDEQLENSKVALVQSEKMSAFGQLSAGIAHEVKNPLAGILGHAQLAKAKVQDEKMKNHLDIIESETKRTKEIIENLMKFARAEKLELIPTNIWDTVAAATDLVDHQLALQEVKLFRYIKKVPCVMANSNQIQQVLLNLMMNAGHAMEEMQTKELHIYLDHIEEQKIARIRIRDTGCGMPKEVADKIFEPFFTTKPAGKGTGLGLSVSVGIVKDHHANIYVESEVDQGTTFFIDFPIAEDQSLPESTYVPKFSDNEGDEVSDVKSEVEEAPREVAQKEVNALNEPEGELLAESSETSFTDEVTEESDLSFAEPAAQEEVSLDVENQSSEVQSARDTTAIIEEDDEEDDFVEQSLSGAAEEIESYSAADALAGMDLEPESDPVYSSSSPEPTAESSEVNEVTADEETEITSEDTQTDFKVKIRRPKIKR
ncbi:MAG: ATP-binding protein [Bdellovibrionales bacterium]